MPSPYLFKKGDEVICPSCRKNVFVNDDVLIFKAKYLVICPKCGAYVKCEKLQKVDNSEVEE
jgi:transcription elongation factor Elf1